MSMEAENFINEYEDTILKERETVEKYGRHMLVESHIKAGGGVDETTGWRYEYWDIATVRNAPAHLKKMRKVFLDPMPHIVMDQNIPLRGWYQSKHNESALARPRPCMTEAILTQPYGGFCSVGCAFCYINNGVRGYRGQGVTVVDPNYPEKSRKQLRKMRTATAVYMSSFIDPFLELEDYYHNTERLAHYVDEEGLPMFFLTRKIVPGWAYDLLEKNPYSYMQFSINTSNSHDWRLLSPRAASLETMYEQVREMKRHGIYVSIQVNPIVAGIVSNQDIVTLIHELAACGADHLIFKFVEIVIPSSTGMKQVMKRRFGARAEAFESLFTQPIGGFITIAEDYRKASLELFKVECEKAGITMALCYEYEYERDEVGAITSKVGVSMGRQYLTADQCHGHRVPMFSRPHTSKKFESVEACPPSGCLHCADDAGGEAYVPCGNSLLAQAPALLPKDYLNPVYANEIQLPISSDK